MYLVYLQVKDSRPTRCFHTFKAFHQAKKYAELGAKNTKGITIVIDERVGLEIAKFDYRPN